LETRAEVLCVGSELLLPGRVESNGEVLTSLLFDLGIPVWRRSVLPDDLAEMEGSLREALARSSVVVVSGGLGPTEDDRTREAIARAAGAPLRRDEALAARIAERARARGRKVGEPSLRQADLPAGAEAIRNEAGTAPGIWLERDGRVLVALPGVPSELVAMWEREVAPRLAALGGVASGRRFLRTTGIPESLLQGMLPPVESEGVERVITCSTAGVDVQLVGWGEAACDALDVEAARLSAALGDAVYATEERADLAEVAGRLLLGRSETVAVAESCTGGLLGHRLTEVPGSSGWFVRGWVVYTNEAKVEELGVPEEAIRAHGAVSEPVARALAEGAARHAEWGVGITGIAGPTGGSDEKPVGTVHYAVARRGEDTAWRRVRLPGSRGEVKARSAQAALDLLRRRLMGLPLKPGRG
jgi:nicotinamide-nucleotide amidase